MHIVFLKQQYIIVWPDEIYNYASLTWNIFYNPVETGIALLRLAKRKLIVSNIFKVDGCDQTVELYELSPSGKEWVLTNEKLLTTETDSIF